MRTVQSLLEASIRAGGEWISPATAVVIWMRQVWPEPVLSSAAQRMIATVVYKGSCSFIIASILLMI